MYHVWPTVLVCSRVNRDMPWKPLTVNPENHNVSGLYLRRKGLQSIVGKRGQEIRSARFKQRAVRCPFISIDKSGLVRDTQILCGNGKQPDTVEAST
jgi:hypothetical protein